MDMVSPVMTNTALNLQMHQLDQLQYYCSGPTLVKTARVVRLLDNTLPPYELLRFLSLVNDLNLIFSETKASVNLMRHDQVFRTHRGHLL